MVCCVAKGKELLYWNRWDIRASVPEVNVLFREPVRKKKQSCSHMSHGYSDGYQRCFSALAASPPSRSGVLLVLAKKTADGGQLRCGNHMVFTPTKCQHKHYQQLLRQKALPHGPGYGSGCWSYMKLTFLGMQSMNRGIFPPISVNCKINFWEVSLNWLIL